MTPSCRPHGAGLAQIIWARPGAVLVNIWDQRNHDDWINPFRDLALINRGYFVSVIAKVGPKKELQEKVKGDLEAGVRCAGSLLGRKGPSPATCEARTGMAVYTGSWG